jgi:hypothetical protein
MMMEWVASRLVCSYAALPRSASQAKGDKPLRERILNRESRNEPQIWITQRQLVRGRSSQTIARISPALVPSAHFD